MSDAVVVAMISGQAVVLAAVLPLLISTRRHAKTAAEETSNDHPKNMRVEGDERHEEHSHKLDELLRLQRAQGRRIGRVDRRLTALSNRVDTVDERTTPKRKASS